MKRNGWTIYSGIGGRNRPEYATSIEEQNRIAKTLSTASHEIAQIERELSALEIQKRGLMQKLLTGEVRVKV
jgi:hypothetical protein